MASSPRPTTRSIGSSSTTGVSRARGSSRSREAKFADRGLLDELLLTVVPVVLGAGKPLFDRRLPGGPLQLTGTRAFDNGMVELRYEIVR